jgi:NAD-dependent DNA ligase
MSSEIEKLIKYHQDLYDKGTPEISDEEYNALVTYHDAEKGIGPTGDITLIKQMYSLQKVYPVRGDKVPTPCQGKELVESPKYDGNAIELVYINGVLERATTRGDGTKGQDVTAKARLLPIPHFIWANKGIVQVTGEVVATKASPNARNIVSGKLVTEKDLNEAKRVFIEHEVVFIAYGVSPCMNDTYKADMACLDLYGFDVAVNRPYEGHAPTDGQVFRVNDNKTFEQLGFTSKFPRGAYAVKQDEPPVETTLLEVLWQVGASGKVTPVAVLEPVDVKGTTISRATLNNISFIESLGIEIGSRVALIRAGDIIPKIVGKAE